MYEGNYENDKKNGMGMFTWESGNYYRGCYRDNQTRVLEVEMFPGDGQNSVDKCQQLCRKENYKLFGVESG